MGNRSVSPWRRPAVPESICSDDGTLGTAAAHHLLHMAFAYLAHTLALHDDPGWKPLDPSRDPDRWLHVEWSWSGEPGNWTRRSRILEFGEYWHAPDRTGGSGG